MGAELALMVRPCCYPRNLGVQLMVTEWKTSCNPFLLCRYAISAEMIKRWRNQAEEVTPSRFLGVGFISLLPLFLYSWPKFGRNLTPYAFTRNFPGSGFVPKITGYQPVSGASVSCHPCANASNG